MSKNSSIIKKVTKAEKPVKGKPASKKSKPEKPAKSKKNKKVVPAVKKITAKKAAKKIVKQKSIIKKTAKPIKKVVAKKITAKKAVKPSEKVETKKATVLLVNPLGNKANKADKKSSVVKVSKQNKIKKEEKAIKSSPSKNKQLVPEKEENFKKMKDKPNKSKRGRKPKGSDDDEPEIVHDELVEQLIRSTKKMRSQPKKPRILRTFTNPRASLAAALPDADKKNVAHLKKEPKGKFELEYVAHTSPGILFEFLTTPSGLSEWFADDVNIQDGIFTFFWDGSEQKAKLLSFREDKYVRFQWFDKPDGTFFEFRIERDDLTGDISLLVVDFADEATEMKTSKLLWDSQISKLLHVIGSY